MDPFGLRADENAGIKEECGHSGRNVLFYIRKIQIIGGSYPYENQKRN